jgi:transposase
MRGDEQRPPLGQSEVAKHTTLEVPMPEARIPSQSSTAVRIDIAAIFVSLELSQSKWLVTSISPGGGARMSQSILPAGDVASLLKRLGDLKRQTRDRVGGDFPIITIQEAGLDGFWLHRVLMSEGIESHVVDPASVAVSRRKRRAKTDKIDGEALVRTLLAYKRGEPRVCSMAIAPTPADEDARRLVRERKTLIRERISHVNRIKGLLYSQGIKGYEPLPRDRRERLEVLITGDDRPLPPHLKAQIKRELDRLELVLKQIAEVEKARSAMLASASSDPSNSTRPSGSGPDMLLGLKGIGEEAAAILWTEGLSRHFDNRRQVAAYAGLAPTPWQSGQVNREQGVSKAGNPRLRTALIQIAWLWIQHQPDSALTKWFKARVLQNGGRLKKPTIVAVARKLIVALWKYVNAGVVIEGAIMTHA